jgi:cytochrome c
MKKAGWLFAALLLFSCPYAIAAGTPDNEHASREQAVTMVKKAVAYIKANGTEKSYALIDDHAGPFIDRDLYVMVYRLDGMCLAHGSNEKLIGRNLIDAQDVDGKLYVKERVETAKTKDNYWLDYKFSDPVTKKLEPKSTYCEKLNDTVVCAGVYNPVQ